MRQLIESLPGAHLPNVEHESDRQALPLLAPDDDDLIRPAAEETLGRVAELGPLAQARSFSLAKHLLWTFGPDHRALPFLLQMRCEVENDRLVTVDPEVGWLHQGVEKTLETTRFENALDIIERLHPANPSGHQLAWVLAVERLCGVDAEVPRRAQLWRMVIAELSRMAEHLRVLSSLVLSSSGRRDQRRFADAERRVGTLLEIAAWSEGSCRAAVGGVCGELPDGLADTLRRGIADALAPMKAFSQQQARLPSFVDGLRGLGALDRGAAFENGFTGPALRACGVDDDVRLRDPYFAYAELVPRVPVRERGDARARFGVRLDELFTSSALLLRTLSAFEEAEGPLRLDDDALPRDDEGRLTPAPGRAAISVEVGGGELSILLWSDGGPTPRRARLRTPSFPLCAALSKLLVGARLDEVVTILQSLGMVGTEIDR
jgi:NADH-quinone oxidoreductase subunit D